MSPYESYGSLFMDCKSLPHVTSLHNNLSMPLLGVGTTHSGGYSHESLVYALEKCEYRMIDTAKRYGVEKNIALAIHDSGIPRESLFLISKLWPVDVGFQNTTKAFHASCKRLDTNYLDSYLIHFPQIPSWIPNKKQVKKDTWRALELLYDAGKCRSIGVSNYDVDDLEELLDDCSVKPHINQYEFNPSYNPKRLRKFCANNRIRFMGYCPLAKGKLLSNPVIMEMARKYDRSPSQICLRWNVQQGVPAIPKSLKPQRLAENAQIFDWGLDNEDMDILSHGLHNEYTKCVALHNVEAKFSLPDGYKLI